MEISKGSWRRSFVPKFRPNGNSMMSLIGIIDATDESMEDGFVGRLKDLEAVKSQLGDRFHAVVSLYRSPGSPDKQGEALLSPWKGEKTYLVAPSNSNRIVSTPLESSGDSNPPGVEELAKLIGAHAKPMPVKVVYIHGHGLGTVSARIPMTDLGIALKTVYKNNGWKPNLVFLEACMSGNLEGLVSLDGKADVAIVLEESTPQNALPLTQMLLNAFKGKDVRTVARKMLDAAPRRDTVRTVSAIDLNKIKALHDSVKRLEFAIVEEIGLRPELHRWLRGAVHDAMYYLPRAREYGYGDLGEFLKSINLRPWPPAVKTRVGKAEALLKEAIIDQKAYGNYMGVSGLSFNARSFCGGQFSFWDLVTGR